MNEPIEILLVEDNPHDVKLTLAAFAQHKFANRIHVARDGEEALEFLSRPPAGAPLPKIILLDLKLPKIDGIDVLRHVKSDPRLRLIPVVVLTSSKEERDLVETYALGVNSYIAKPVGFDQFIETARILGMYWLMFNRLPADRGAVGERRDN